MMNAESKPVDVKIQRAHKLLRIQWADGHQSAYALDWLRGQCPCATCREERHARVMEEASASFRLNSGPPPSDVIVGAEFVGAYAIRFDWADGHSTGIYPFKALRQSCPCAVCNPGGAPPLIADEAL